MIGTSLNQYRITASIGAGGMGEVFRARDTRLNRDVAVKVLPKDFASDANRLRRFEQEAKTLAALNHPNVLTIHDAGVHEGAPYLVSELLEGKTLREEMNCSGAVSAPTATVTDRRYNPLSVRKATEFALQIAHGLAAAHNKGVVHRDLKPENIFVTKDGRVKILDFGLAKLKEVEKRDELRVERQPPGIAHSQLSTRIALNPADSTEPGKVMGTPSYMAPEQVRGEAVDHRADIFAFGCVLYEMLSGTRAFRGNTAVGTMNAILTEEPPELAELNPNLSPTLDRVVRRCLEKQAERRFQSASDLAFAIESVGSLSTSSVKRASTVASGPHFNLPRVLPWVLAGVCLAGWFYSMTSARRADSKLAARDAARSALVTPPLRKLEIQVPAPRKGGFTELKALAISPDGRKLAFVNTDGLWLRSLDQGTPAVLLASGENVFAPFWSPQSTDIAYFEANKLWKVPVTGGRPAVVCTAPLSQSDNSGGAWFPDDRIFFATGNSGLIQVSAKSGQANLVLLPTAQEWDFHTASGLPDGRGVLFATHTSTNSNPNTIAVWSPADTRKILLQRPGVSLTRPAYCRSGHVLYESDNENGSLWAFPFSLSKLERTGEPFRVSNEARLASVADEGTLVYERQAAQNVFDLRQLVWVDRSGRVTGKIGDPQKGLAQPRLSPDGKKVIVVAGESFSGMEIWIVDTVRGTPTRLTRNNDFDAQPYWFSDGQDVVFARERTNTMSSIRKSADGVGAEEVIYPTGCAALSPRSGKYFLPIPSIPGVTRRHYVLLSDPEKKSVPFREGLEGVYTPKLSPDDSLLAYSSAESGRDEIYVVAFPGLTNKVRVSREGGRDPQWRPDGSELFYLSRNGRELMSVPVKRAEGLQLGEPEKLFALPEPIPPGIFNGGNPFDVSSDGQRFVMVQSVKNESDAQPEGRASVLVVENWFEEFREKK